MIRLAVPGALTLLIVVEAWYWSRTGTVDFAQVLEIEDRDMMQAIGSNH